MNWFLIALLPPALWSITNHIDKYLLTKYFKGAGVGALMVFSSLIGLLLLPIIIVLHPAVLSQFDPQFLLISLNGFLYILAVLPYFYALQRDDASIAVPLFQLIPVYSYFLAYIFLGETLNLAQILGGIIIIAGAILITLDIVHIKKIRLKWDVLGYMALSSLFFSLNFLFFKFFALEADIWVTSFWEYIGFAIFAFILVAFIRPYRVEFINVLRKNSMQVLTVNGTNEVVNIVAKIAFNVASLLTPITLTWIVNGLQPMFVFIYGIGLTIFLPKLSQENISRKILVQKVVAILIMLAGTILINQNF